MRLRRIREDSRVICPKHGSVVIVRSIYSTGQVAVQHSKRESELRKIPEIEFFNAEEIFRA